MVSHAAWKTWPSGLSNNKKPRPSASIFVLGPCFFTRHWRPWSNPTTLQDGRDAFTSLFLFFFWRQVSRAGTSNYIPQILWDVISCFCPWYLILAQHSSIASVCGSNLCYIPWWRHYMVFMVSLYALLNKGSSCRWFETKNPHVSSL